MTLLNWVGIIALGFMALLGLRIVWLVWVDRIDLSRLVSEANGDASMSRFQLLIFTFVIAASLFLVTATGSKFPDEIPQGVLLLLGISASTYGVSKGIQLSSDAGVPVVTVTPQAAHAAPGGQAIQFKAAVDQAANQAVTWSVTPDVGTIQDGLYTPPAAAPAGQTGPMLLTVRATSAAN